MVVSKNKRKKTAAVKHVHLTHAIKVFRDNHAKSRVNTPINYETEIKSITKFVMHRLVKDLVAQKDRIQDAYRAGGDGVINLQITNFIHLIKLSRNSMAWDFLNFSDAERYIHEHVVEESEESDEESEDFLEGAYDAILARARNVNPSVEFGLLMVIGDYPIFNNNEIEKKETKVFVIRVPY